MFVEILLMTNTNI